jgi:hypothetical protein
LKRTKGSILRSDFADINIEKRQFRIFTLAIRDVRDQECFLIGGAKMVSYDMHIYGLEAWDELVQRNLGIVIDPLVFRLGQFFLEGESEAGTDKERRWRAIESDIGALVSFFDLIVLHNQLPAFNYHDTFDRRLDFGDRLGAVLNAPGDKTLVHVDVEYHMYRAAKAAAIDQLLKRLKEGPFVPKTTEDEILATLDAIEYEWEPRLEKLEKNKKLQSPRRRRLARFLLGQLVFAGYAQQTGAPHVLAPKRSLMLVASGLRTVDTAKTSEAALYKELGRRLRNAGAGWRCDELPWTPSFLPFLLKQMKRYREGPDVLLKRAKELRSSRAIQRYRTLRDALVSENVERSEKARKELQAAADSVVTSLDSNRQELQLFRHIAVEILPKAVGAAGGALVGALVAGPAGAAGGGVAGVVGEEALRPVQRKLWGWFVDGLPFRSARKLLTRSVRAEQEMQRDFTRHLRDIWENRRRSS